MAVEERYRGDVEAILARRHDNGADYWTTPDRRLLKGAPFNTLDCMAYLLELGLPPDDPVLAGAAELVFAAWREDGRFRLYPKGSVFPCQTACAAQVLCRMGLADDARVVKTLQHLLDIQQPDGGWRCNKFYFGRGPETEYSNPGTTLMVLDAFRMSAQHASMPALDKAVEFLLAHWDIKVPIGPCHYGIGTLFMQVEYPFRGYNLFAYVHTLSFYAAARGDKRFLQAFAALQSQTVDGQIVVQRVVPKLAKLEFCKKNAPSALATRRYNEILDNLGMAH